MGTSAVRFAVPGRGAGLAGRLVHELGETGQCAGPDRDADGHLVAGPVVADLELERVVQAALKRFRQGCERERELR
jgi:hypothetical protein